MEAFNFVAQNKQNLRVASRPSALAFKTMSADAPISADFQYTAIPFSNARSAVFVGSTFSNCEFIGRATYTNTNFEGCSFTKCYFENVDFSNANFATATFKNCTFNNCNLTSASFQNANLETSYFFECELGLCSFESAQLKLVEFDSSKLVEMNCSSVSATQTLFKRCEALQLTLSQAVLDETKFFGCDLTMCDASNARLDSCAFILCDLSLSDFSNLELNIELSMGDNDKLQGRAVNPVDFYANCDFEQMSTPIGFGMSSIGYTAINPQVRNLGNKTPYKKQFSEKERAIHRELSLGRQHRYMNRFYSCDLRYSTFVNITDLPLKVIFNDCAILGMAITDETMYAVFDPYSRSMLYIPPKFRFSLVEPLIGMPICATDAHILDHKGILRFANLQKLSFQNISFDDLDLSETNLSDSDFRNCSFISTNLSNSQLVNTKLTGTDMSRANLSGCDLSGTELSFSNLTNANLSNARLKETNLTNTILKDTNFDGAICSTTLISKLYTARMLTRVQAEAILTPSGISAFQYLRGRTI